MKLEGAKIRSIYRICTPISDEEKTPLKINIPFYQRPFKWGSDEGIEKIELLIQDFFENYDIVRDEENNQYNNQLEYFAGSIVTVIKDDYHDLIDGQQRITTIFLMNYIKFLLLREYIARKISRKAGVESDFDGLSKTVSNLFKDGENNIRKLKKEIIQKYNNANLCSGQEREDKFDELLNYYKSKMFLPKIPFDSKDKYEDKYFQKLTKYLSEKELSLKYNRDNFNDRIKISMSSARIKLTLEEGPELYFVNDQKNEGDQIIENYINAIKAIFNEIKRYLEEEQDYNSVNFSLDKTEMLIEKIDDFLNYLSFCVIQTTNTDDAYTLFEVLNDRALELDDLDLIKNMFYKEYCQKNKKDTQELDNDIEELEELWGENIFTPNTAEWKKRFTAFLGTIYLTGDNHIRYSKNQKYRENIKGFLEKQYDDKYNLEDIKYNFCVFQAAKEFLNKFNVKYQKKNSQSYVAEANKYSITYKTTHMLRALKQYGVIASLFNIIMNNYTENYTEINCEKDFDIKKFKNYLNEIINDFEHKNTNLTDVHKCAFNLRKIALLANNYNLPRNYAKEIIEYNNFGSKDTSKIELKINMIKNSKKEFFEWTNRWYKGTKDDLRIKILFLELLRTEKSNDKLHFRPVYYNIDNPENIDLDHFEPKEFDKSNPDSYFIPDVIGQKNREEYVNQLGNFMILTSKINQSLSNKPAEKSLKAYKRMGIGDSWLVKELEDYLEKFSEVNNNLRVPNKEFFIERKKSLQKHFLSIIDRDFKAKSADIKSS